MNAPQWRSHDVWAAAAVAALPFVFFWPVWVLGAAFCIDDMPLWNFFFRWHVRCLAGGVLPLWNSKMTMGYPAFASLVPVPTVYPIGFFCEFFRIGPSYVALVHMSLAGLSMYVLGRTMRLSHWAALLAGVAWGSGRWFIGQIPNLTPIVATAWIPLVIAGVHRFVASRRKAWIVAAGLVTGLQLLGGHPQMALMGWVVLALYGLFGPKGGSSRVMTIARAAVGSASAVVLGVGLAAMRLVPGILFASMSERWGGMPTEEFFLCSLDWEHLALFVLPNFYGSPRTIGYSGGGIFCESHMYIGLIPLALAVASLARLSDWRARFGWAVFFVSTAFAFGGHLPAYRVLQHVPMLREFTVPMRWMSMATLGLAVAAGAGLDSVLRLVNGKSAHRRPLLFPLLCAAALLGLGWARFDLNFGPSPSSLPLATTLMYARALDVASCLILVAVCGYGVVLWRWGHLRRRWFAAGAVLFLALDLGLSGIGSVSPTRMPIPREDLPSFAKTLARRAHSTRVAFGPSVPIGLVEYAADAALPCFQDRLLQYTTARVDKLTRRVEALRPFLGGGRFTRHFLGVGYLVTLLRRSDPCVRQIEHEDGLPLVYAFTDGPRRIAVVPRARVVGTDAAALDAVLAPNFDAREEAVFVASAPRTEPTPRTAERPSLVVRNDGELEMALDVLAAKGEMLVVKDSWYPGWRAFANRKRTRVWRADYLLRAIPIKTNRSSVHMVFAPKDFKAGAMISLAAVLVLGICAMLVLLPCDDRCRPRA